jgi:Polyketide cyclase / dehydrase and lipid transport
MIVNVQVRIEAPIGRVFDLMADARNEPSWNSRVSTSELVSGEPIGEGTEFTTVNRGQTYVATLTEYDRPRHLGYDVSGKPLSIHGSLDFAEEGEVTTMTGVFDFTPHGPMRLMLPLMSGAVRRDLPRQMASFKEFCEADAAR